MKTQSLLLGITALLAFAGGQALAQPVVNSGSDGSLGDLVVNGVVSVPLPPDGKLKYKSVRIEQGGTLRFVRNAANTPVYLLATTNVFIGGFIDVSGDNGAHDSPGAGGPGGFDGGVPGLNGPAGDGDGPGGGISGVYNDANRLTGSGSFASRGNEVSRPGYGNSTLDPLIGGSGGGGLAGSEQSVTGYWGGAGGGGALLIASNTKIEFSANGAAKIEAKGGIGTGFGGANQGGDGSGGAVRLVAPEISGYVNIAANSAGGRGGLGRIRIDGAYTPVASQLQGSSRIGSNFQVFPTVVPSLSIIAAAGTTIPDGSGPVVQVNLSRSAPVNQKVKLRAKDFTGFLPITVSVSPEQGPTTRYVGEIDMSKNPAETEISVVLTPGTVNRIQAWTQ